MKELPLLDGLSHSEKDALITGLWQEVQTLRLEVEHLKQKRVKKTARNSSLPPAQGFKPNQSSAESTSGKGKVTEHHHQGGRALSQNNASEQALRWSVVFRKVTNGFVPIGEQSYLLRCAP